MKKIIAYAKIELIYNITFILKSAAFNIIECIFKDFKNNLLTIWFYVS